MIVGAPRWDGVELSSEIQSPAGDRRIVFRLPSPVGAPVFDALLIASLLPAMASWETLRIPGAVSPKLLAALPRIQEIFLTWDRLYWKRKYPHRRRLRWVEVEAQSRQAGAVQARTACLFSGGVDSFYTALKHIDEIDALVFVHGFDVGLDQADLRHKVTEGVRGAAVGLRKALVEVEGDFRSMSSGLVSWGTYHGAVLGSVAALLSQEFGKIYLPASYSYSHLRPWGSHPLVDPLWSTDEIEILHDGCELTRDEKVRSIAEDESARRWLRVCLDNPDGAYNCSSCDKCLRTMVRLQTLGMLGSFTSFPPLDVANLKFSFKPKVPEDSWRRSWEEILQSIRLSGGNTDLVEPIERLLASGGDYAG